MSNLEDLVRIFTAAGGTAHPEGKGMYLLYIDPERQSLTSKLWTGKDFDPVKEVVASKGSIHAHSPACFLITPAGKFVIYISPSFKLCVSSYSEDEDVWDEDDSLVHNGDVHPNSKLAAVRGVDGRKRIFFQDPSMHLICVDDEWTPTKLNVDVAEGSPFATLIVEGKVRLFYIAKDNAVYSIDEQQNGEWSNPEKFSSYSFTSKLKRILVIPNGDTFALSEGNELLKDGEEIGKVDSTGKFLAKSPEQAGFVFFFFFFASSWW